MFVLLYLLFFCNLAALIVSRTRQSRLLPSVVSDSVVFGPKLMFASVWSSSLLVASAFTHLITRENQCVLSVLHCLLWNSQCTFSGLPISSCRMLFANLQILKRPRSSFDWVLLKLCICNCIANVHSVCVCLGIHHFTVQGPLMVAKFGSSLNHHYSCSDDDDASFFFFWWQLGSVSANIITSKSTY